MLKGVVPNTGLVCRELGHPPDRSSFNPHPTRRRGATRGLGLHDPAPAVSILTHPKTGCDGALLPTSLHILSLQVAPEASSTSMHPVPDRDSHTKPENLREPLPAAASTGGPAHRETTDHLPIESGKRNDAVVGVGTRLGFALILLAEELRRDVRRGAFIVELAVVLVEDELTRPLVAQCRVCACPRQLQW